MNPGAQGQNPVLPCNKPRASSAHLFIAKAAQPASHVLVFSANSCHLNEKFV